MMASANASTHYDRMVDQNSGGPSSCDYTHLNGPAKSELIHARVTGAGTPQIQVRPNLLGNGECPHYRSPRLRNSRVPSTASLCTSFSAFSGLVFSLVPVHTSLFCGSENTKVSTVTMMSVLTSGDLEIHGSLQPIP